LDSPVTDVTLVNATTSEPIANILSPRELPYNTGTRMFHQTDHLVKRNNLRRIRCVNLKTIPETFPRICCVNPRSVKNKTSSLCDYVLSNDLVLSAVIETWLGGNVDQICISELVTFGIQMISIRQNILDVNVSVNGEHLD